MADQKLLPCPFCRSAAEVKSAAVDGKEYSNVSCSKTTCPGFNNISHQRATKLSVKLWNTRTADVYAPQPAEQSVSHDWDDQDKCRRCGDRDWYASATCTPKWQPIETAPDREYILILVDGQITGVGSTYLGDWWASMPNGEVCELNEPPTHWMPLPEAP